MQKPVPPLEPAAPAASAAPAATDGGSAAQIAVSLRRSITDGAYADNERLPPERQLAVEFGASRGTIRAALRQLEEVGLLSRKVGSGTFVTYRREAAEHDEVAESTSPVELIDVRLGIEPQIVRLAVAHASGRDIERLERALRRLERSGEDVERFAEADSEFHLTLVECTGNPLMIWLYRQIDDLRRHKQWSAMKDQILQPSRIARYNAQHRAMYEAIRARDMEGAVEQVSLHLEGARHDLLGIRR